MQKNCLAYSTMTIAELYNQFHIMSHLERHMLGVGAVGKVIVDSWTGSESLDRDVVLHTCLVHDLANAIKFDFSQDLTKFGMEGTEEEVAEMKQAQADMVEKYGDNEDEAKMAIVKELGFSEDVLYVLKYMDIYFTEEIMASSNWELKICSYADSRIGPNGILSLQERFDELIVRYRDKPSATINHPRRDEFIPLFHQLEGRLQERTSVDLEGLSDSDLEACYEELKGIKL